MSREMKDSGVQWIGEIPKEWEIRKMDSIADKITDYVASGSFASLNENVKYLDEPDYAMLVRTVDLSDKSSSKRVYINKHAYDFLSNSNLFGGELILSNIGSVGNVYIYKPLYSLATLAPNSILVNMKDNNRYFYYWFINPYGNESLKNIGSNAVQLKFNKTQLRQLLVPRPPVEEQEKICNYLDKKVSQIDDIISKQKSLIEKYKAYKQSLITETVTKGLNKNVPMKDSGIEWVGEIPSHWDTIKIKNTCSLKGRIGWQGLKSDEFIEEGPYLITGVNFKNGLIDWDTCFHITEERYEEAAQIQIREGDLLITKDGTIGKLAIVKDMPYKTSLNSGVLLIRNISDLYINRFLYYILASNIFWMWYKMNQTGNSTIFHLYQEKFKEFEYTLPNKDEQIKISEYLDKKCNEIDSAISKKEQLILKLEDYKKSLIYECVTGKREVN